MQAVGDRFEPDILHHTIMISQKIEIDAESLLKIVKLYVEETAGVKITHINVNIKGAPVLPYDLGQTYQFKIVAEKQEGVTRKAMKGVIGAAKERKIELEL